MEDQIKTIDEIVKEAVTKKLEGKYFVYNNSPGFYSTSKYYVAKIRKCTDFCVEHGYYDATFVAVSLEIEFQQEKGIQIKTHDIELDYCTKIFSRKEMIQYIKKQKEASQGERKSNVATILGEEILNKEQ